MSYLFLFLQEGHLGDFLLDAGAEHHHIAVSTVARLGADQRLDVHHVFLVCNVTGMKNNSEVSWLSRCK